MAEMQELKTRLGWKYAVETGKFYDSKGSDGWYYYIYGEPGAAKPVTEIAGLVCKGKVKGDVAVIRSGPDGSETPEEFTKKELSRDLVIYKTRDSQKVFVDREASHIAKTMKAMGFTGPPTHMFSI